MEVLRVFNNNVVLARRGGWQDVIATGRGLGFQAKPGQQVDEERLVRLFVPDEGRDSDTLGSLVAAIPPEHLDLAAHALEAVREELGFEPGSASIVALADHLSFAFERRRQRLEVEYPLRAEVSHLYPAEFRTAARIIDFVEQHGGVQLPDGEAVPVAMHLVTAGFSGGDLSATYRMTGVIAQLFDVLEQVLATPVDRESVNAARFIAHLRYFFVRAHSERQLNDASDRLGDSVRHSFPEAYVAARRLQTVMELRLGQPVTSAELHVPHDPRGPDDRRGRLGGLTRKLTEPTKPHGTRARPHGAGRTGITP